MSRMLKEMLVGCLTLVLAGICLGQEGVSTAGATRTKYLGEKGVFPTSREVIVEDFINYHRHEIGRPKAGEAVALDVRWGSEKIANREAVLQVGLATALAHDRKQIRPLNLSLVIDKSGSMAAGDKMSRVKTSLLKLVEQLRPTDTLSIVLFDTNAEVLLPSQKVSDRQRIKSLIQGISPGSSTNIHAGLMLGYEQALKNFSKESTNRVVLLTDGIANQGVADPKSIANDSLGFNDRGIDLSTIGVGLELNHDLLHDLAKSGRGLFHFIAAPDDIEKVFVKELQSLFSPVATEPSVTIEFGQGLELTKVFGYEPTRFGNSVTVKLDNLNNGATQVVLLRFGLTRGASSLKEFPVKVTLNYFDIDRNRRVETVQRSTVLRGSERGGTVEDGSVAKNYTIAVLADSIHEMAVACEGNRLREAERYLTTSINAANERYPDMDDEDVKRTYATAVNLRNMLNERLPQDGSDGEAEGRATNSIIPNGDFMQGNTGFLSDREYIKPDTNCLWGGYYTIADQFSSPFRLHTNVRAEAFAAPKGGRMMYMNSGGSESFTVWSAKVSCNPRTTYRVSFQEIGLSGGPEWRNSYEIRINGDRVEPQLGGDGKFVTISREWNSGSSQTATVSIVRLPNAHGGGVIGIGNIEMVPVGRGGR